MQAANSDILNNFSMTEINVNLPIKDETCINILRTKHLEIDNELNKLDIQFEITKTSITNFFGNIAISFDDWKKSMIKDLEVATQMQKYVLKNLKKSFQKSPALLTNTLCAVKSGKTEIIPIQFVLNDDFIDDKFKKEIKNQICYLKFSSLEIDRIRLEHDDGSYVGTTAVFKVWSEDVRDVIRFSKYFYWKVEVNGGAVVETKAWIKNSIFAGFEFAINTEEIHTVSFFVLNQHIEGSPYKLIPNTPVVRLKNKKRSPSASDDLNLFVMRPKKEISPRSISEVKFDLDPTSGVTENKCSKMNTSNMPLAPSLNTANNESGANGVFDWSGVNRHSELLDRSRRENGITSVSSSSNFWSDSDSLNADSINTDTCNSTRNSGIKIVGKVKLGEPLRRPRTKNANVTDLVTLSTNDSADQNEDLKSSHSSTPGIDLLNGNLTIDAAQTNSNQLLKPEFKTVLMEEFGFLKKGNLISLNSYSNKSDLLLNKPDEENRIVEKKLSNLKIISEDDYFSCDKLVIDETAKGETVSLRQKRLVAKCVFKFVGNEAVQLCKPLGVTQLQSKNIVVADTFADRMLLFSEDGTYLHEFGSSTILEQPSAIAVLPNGNFAVRNSQEITIFSSECSYLFSIGTDYLKKPYGLASDGKGYLYTVDAEVNEDAVIVKMDATTGDLILRTVVQLASPHFLRESKPRFLAYRDPSTLLIADLGLDNVSMVDVNTGNVLKCFGTTGQRDGEFRGPSGVACDVFGFIVVADSKNHRIQIFTPDGDFVTVLRIDRPLNRPSEIFINADGHLLVLNFGENSLVKYKFHVQ